MTSGQMDRDEAVGPGPRSWHELTRLPPFNDAGKEEAFRAQFPAAANAGGCRWPGFGILYLLYCAVLGPFNPFAATVLLILWIYSRASEKFTNCLMPALILSYFYLVVAIGTGEFPSNLFDVSALAALNIIAIRTRRSHDLIARGLFLRNAALQRLATLDELTTVYNRRHICELGRREFDRSRRSGGPFCVMLIDVDHFKEINDRHGHAAGDEVLLALVVVSEGSLRSQDIIGRYGGDEFLVLLPDTLPSAAWRTADRLRRSIRSRHVPIGDRRVRLGVSIGIAALEHETEDFQSLISHADVALYNAKACGRDRVRLWPDLNAHQPEGEVIPPGLTACNK